MTACAPAAVAYRDVPCSDAAESDRALIPLR
jgi:hypothetical protein